MQRIVPIGLAMGLVLALSQPVFSADKSGFFSFIKKAPAEGTEKNASDAPKTDAAPKAKSDGKSVRAASASRMKPESIYAGRVYTLPKDPNRYIVKIPQAPKAPAPVPRTDALQKPEERDLPR